MHGSAPEFFAHSGWFDDIDELSEASRGWDVEFHQLDRGSFKGSLRQISCGPVLITHIFFNRRLELTASAQAGSRTFGVHMTQPARWCRMDSSEGDIQAHRGGEEVEVITQPGYGAYTVTLAEDFFGKICEQVGFPELGEPSKTVDVFTCHPSKSKELYNNLHNGSVGMARSMKLPDYPRASQYLQLEFLPMLCRTLVSAQPSNILLTPKLRAQAIRRAKDYIASFADVPPTIRDLCQAAGVSERTLHYAFLEELGVTPKAYTKAYRLNSAKKELRRSDPSCTRIADIANHWGFWHMGQFAADYRKMFSELPSETIQMRAASTP